MFKNLLTLSWKDFCVYVTAGALSGGAAYQIVIPRAEELRAEELRATAAPAAAPSLAQLMELCPEMKGPLE